MGHNTLSDKLDQIQREELGIHFDEAILWEDLSAKLANEKGSIIDRRLLIAACITLLILLFPIVFINDSVPFQLKGEIATTETVKTEVVEELNVSAATIAGASREVIKTETHYLDKKDIEFNEIASIEFPVMDLKPIPTREKSEFKRQSFADQDISIIQANLGKRSIEKGKNFELKAQFQASTQPVQLDNQALKIKLFEISKE